MIAADLDSIHLAFGDHKTREEGMCLLEAVAFLAGERHTDRPQCVCPTLAAFGRSWNDGLSDEDRNRLLKPFIAQLVGTRSTPEVKQRRAFMAADWAVRTCAPVWLRAAGLEDEAGSLEALHPLSSAEACREAMPTICQAREAALLAVRAAARAAATDAAVDAALDAVRASAMDAAMVAAVYATEDPDVYPAATAAAVFVVRTAAVDAAGAAAPDAAWAVLRPHVAQLQASAVDLYERMIEVAP